METKLPLKLRTGIRDHWDSKDCPKNKACAALAGELGYDVSLRPEWPVLLAELGPLYNDKSQLAADVATMVESFCQAMRALIENDGGLVDEGWSGRMIAHFSPAQAVRLYMEMRAGTGGEVRLRKEGGDHSVVFVLPKARIPGENVLISGFQGQLIRMFLEGGEGEDGEVDEGEWADIDGDKLESRPAAPDARTVPHGVGPGAGAGVGVRAVPDVQYLPDPKRMLNPEELLSKPPYHLLVRDHGGEILVECSHSPTLEVLAGWFGKWAKVNHDHTNRPPQVKCELHPSSWGLSTMHERLTLKPSNSWWKASVTVVLALVEGSLGYTQVDVSGGMWVYRKDTEFKRSGY